MPEYVTRSEAETMAVARRVARDLQPGDVLLLSGDLGAGKTAFVRGLVEGLAGEGDDVSSPTFTIVHEYRGGRMSVYHADLYRLDQADTGELGLEELQHGVLAIEWPERLAHVPAGARRVRIDILEGDTRRIEIAGPGQPATRD